MVNDAFRYSDICLRTLLPVYGNLECQDALLFAKIVYRSIVVFILDICHYAFKDFLAVKAALADRKKMVKLSVHRSIHRSIHRSVGPSAQVKTGNRVYLPLPTRPQLVLAMYLALLLLLRAQNLNL